MNDLKDFYILGNTHPRFNFNKIIEEKELIIIIDKIELILFTNKGDFIGDLEFGCDIETLLWKTSIDNQGILKVINQQISTYIPEISNYVWKVELDLVDGNMNDDILFINIYIEDYRITSIFQ
jgi:hypothetical protein